MFFGTEQIQADQMGYHAVQSLVTSFLAYNPVLLASDPAMLASRLAISAPGPEYWRLV